MMTGMFNRSCSGSFAQANGSAFARASFNFILFVIGAVLAVSIFAFSDALLSRAVLIGILLAAVLLLRVLIIRRPAKRPGLSAA